MEENIKTNDLSLEGRKLLWVEDDKYLTDIISRKLSHEKCILLHAGDGEKALAIAEKESPEMVLLDILLPGGMDGFEILKRLRSNDKTKSLTVLILSNLGQKSDIEKGKELGANGFLVKATVTLDEIVHEIKSLINKKN